MAILNYSTILKALEKQIENNTRGYIVTRNLPRNNDPNICLQQPGGWIGIYMDTINYIAHTTGSTPWKVNAKPMVEVQVANAKSAEDCEESLNNAVKEIVDAIETDRTIGGTVRMTLGYDIKFLVNTEVIDCYHFIAQIRPDIETRS